MIGALTLLLVCQLAGELIAQLTGAPVPGPVLGMVLLFAGLVVKGSVPEPLRQMANTILLHLPVLFVPAGVGLMLHFGRLREEWLAILVAVLVSTWLTIVVTAVVMRLGIKAIGDPQPDAAEPERDRPANVETKRDGTKRDGTKP